MLLHTATNVDTKVILINEVGNMNKLLVAELKILLNRPEHVEDPSFKLVSLSWLIGKVIWTKCWFILQ